MASSLKMYIPVGQGIRVCTCVAENNDSRNTASQVYRYLAKSINGRIHGHLRIGTSRHSPGIATVVEDDVRSCHAFSRNAICPSFLVKFQVSLEKASRVCRHSKVKFVFLGAEVESGSSYDNGIL